jgi:lipid-binding SYLF domain-containing protein
MNRLLPSLVGLAALGWMTGTASAATDREAIELFRNAGQSAAYFNQSYGFAVFPNIGKAGFVVGGAHGTGHVYVNNRVVGKTDMTQVNVGLQLGGQDYSEIVFFEDERALREFTSGSFEFGSDAGVAGAASVNTAGVFRKGMAVFTILKGGLTYSATLAGQKFSYSATEAAK